MKAKLIFDLSDVDDKLEYARMLKATDMACVLFDLKNFLRGISKSDNEIPKDIIIADVYNIINEIDLDEIL